MSQNNKNSNSDILEYASLNMIMLSPEALLELESLDYKDVISKANLDGLFIIDKEYINSYKKSMPNETNLEKDALVEVKSVEVLKSRYIYAQDIDPDIKIKHETDVTNKSSTKGKISEFYDFFTEKYHSLSTILKRRPNLSPISSKSLIKAQKNERVTLIGMLLDTNLSKNGNIVLNFDDTDGEFRVIVMQKDTVLFDQAKHMIKDDVVAINGTKLADNIIIAKEIEYPDMSHRVSKKSDREVYALTISDIHVGSKLFFGKEFQNFIDFLNLKNLSDSDYNLASKIKYIFIAGDVVDGVGVYPQQISELDIYSIYDQYQELSKFLEQIPEYIEVVLGPGNHDSVRLADPQMAIPKEFAKPLYQIKNLHMVGSPVGMDVEGQRVLMYHGNSMPAMQSIMGLELDRPDLAMIEYLKRRHLAPIYGTRHPILPEMGGYLLIKEEPDIFITGHIHTNAYNNYRGTTIINPGTWQAQSIYQKEQGHIPTPGRVPIIKLNSAKIVEKVFVDGITKE